jgi:hypothetical protein
MEPHHDAGEMLLPTEETAELISKSFVDAVTSISVGYSQLIGNYPSACALRSVLIGRAPVATTTWEEFMVTKLRFDLPIFSFTVDTNNGVFSAAPKAKTRFSHRVPLYWIQTTQRSGNGHTNYTFYIFHTGFLLVPPLLS